MMLGLFEWFERFVFVLVVCFLVFLGFLQGFQVHFFSFNLFFGVVEVFWFEAFFSVLVFSVFLSVSSLGLLFEVLDNGFDGVVRGEGLVNVVIPVFQDAEVLERAVLSVLDSNYGSLEVLVVAEEGDEDCIGVGEDLASRFSSVSLLVNEGECGKASSINYAVERAEGEYLAFFDADQLVDSDFIPHAVSLLSDYEVVQGRRVSMPKGFVESLSYYEDVLFRLSHQLLKALDFELVLSSSTVMRKSVFDRLNGYDNSMVTEDLDFGHRCYMEGIKTTKVRRYPTYVEAPHSFKDLWGQKKRWVLGQIQILHGKIVEIFGSGNLSRKMLVSLGVTGSAVLGNLLMLTLIPKIIVIVFLGLGTMVLYPLALLSLVSLSLRLKDYYKSVVNHISWKWLFSPFIYPLYSIITCKSLIEYVLTWNGEWYTVDKGN